MDRKISSKLTNRHIRTLVSFVIITLSSCVMTDDYYEILLDQPELIRDYATVYTLGDTLKISGRFRDQTGLKVKIGDAYAGIISIESRIQKYDGQELNLQDVKVLIAEGMGVGPDRPVAITASGTTIEGPAIEIIEDNESGLLHRELTVQKIADYPAGTVPVFCQSGTGNMYFRNNAAHALSRMTPDGTLEEVFNADKFIDNDGTPFTITQVYGAGIDNAERYLYLSVYTEATGQQLEHFYRLCRYDLRDETMEILNKTPYSRLKSRRTLAAAQPFEGNIADVKIYDLSGIFPDSSGNVYFSSAGFIRKLDPSGRYSYIFKSSGLIGGIPEILNPETGDYYTPLQRIRLFPGVVIQSINVEVINPAEGMWYSIRSSNDYETLGNYFIYRIDLDNQAQIASFGGTGSSYYVSGSFGILRGFINSGAGSTNSRGIWGRLPVGEGKLLSLYYQDVSSKLPVWAVLDFDEKRGYRYAPGVFDTKGYRMLADDKLMNHDADSMLYMTANNKTVIVKTIYK